MSWNPAAGGDTFWWIAGIGLVLVTSLSLSWCYWEELRGDQESLSTTVRNVGVVIGGVIAILFAVWRSIVGARQVATAQRGLLNERYQKGAEMLGSEVLSVRLGGIYALAGLAREEPGNYHTKIMRLLCAFVRHPAGKAIDATEPIPDDSSIEVAEIDGGRDEADNDHPQQLREDVQAVMTEIVVRSAAQIKIENKEEYRLDLARSSLEGALLVSAHLERANLYAAHLEEAVMVGAHLEGTNLADAHLEGAWLPGAHLEGAVLDGTHLEGANLSGAVLTNCERLTQEQIDQALAHERALPDIEGVVDVETGEEIVWRGKSLPDQ